MTKIICNMGWNGIWFSNDINLGEEKLRKWKKIKMK